MKLEIRIEVESVDVTQKTVKSNRDGKDCLPCAPAAGRVTP